MALRIRRLPPYRKRQRPARSETERYSSRRSRRLSGSGPANAVKRRYSRSLLILLGLACPIACQPFFLFHAESIRGEICGSVLRASRFPTLVLSAVSFFSCADVLSTANCCS